MHKNNIDMLDAGHRTNIKGGRNALYALLRKHGHFHGDNTPNRELLKQGLFTVEFKQARTAYGIARAYSKTLVTPNGLAWLHEFVKKHGEVKATKNLTAA